MRRRKSRLRLNRAHGTELPPEHQAILVDVARLFATQFALTDAVSTARARRKRRVTFDRLVQEEPRVREAFLRNADAMISFVQRVAPTPSADTPARVRPVAGRAADPRRTPVRCHGLDWEDEEGGEEVKE